MSILSEKGNEMEKDELKKKLEETRPAPWEQIPDIGLYKDQLTEYLKRQHIGFVLEEEEPLTSAMINNYIKAGVLPRANGKRYGRDHVAYLTAVSLLKQVLSVQETGELLGAQTDGGDVRDFYERYRDELDAALNAASGKLCGPEGCSGDGTDKERLSELALRLAVESYADKLLCREILGML